MKNKGYPPCSECLKANRREAREQTIKEVAVEIEKLKPILWWKNKRIVYLADVNDLLKSIANEAGLLKGGKA